jgi:hypothetical protein
MKPIVYFRPSHRLALLVCLFAVQTKAQSAPFVGANTISLSILLADQQAYEAITSVLTKQSIAFVSTENRLLIRSQNNSALAAKGLIFEGQLMLNAGIVELTGRVFEKLNGENQPSYTRSIPILFTKGRNSIQRLAFTYMDALAKQLQSALQGSITYKYQVNAI